MTIKETRHFTLQDNTAAQRVLTEEASFSYGTFSAMDQEQLSPILDKVVREFNARLTARKLEEVQNEYYSLFTDPLGDHHLNLIASQYFDGRNYGKTLIAVRAFLYTARLAKSKSVVDPEDALPIQFSMLGSLAEMEKEGQDSEVMQQTLINDYPIPFMEKLVPVVEANQTANFYSGCAGFFVGYLDLEKRLSC